MGFKHFSIVLLLLLHIESFSQSLLNASNTDSSSIAMVLWRGKTDAEKGFTDAFRGSRAKFTIYDCNQNNDTLFAIRNRLLVNKPDLIYAFGTTVAVSLAGKYNTYQRGMHITETPIVFAVVADPFGAGLLNRDKNISGRNITGVTHLIPLDVQMNLINTIITIKSIAVIYNPDESNSRLQVNQINNLSITHNINVISIPLTVFKNRKSIDSSFTECINAIKSSHADLLYIPSDSYIISNARKIIDASHSVNIPTFSATEQPIRKDGAFVGMVSKYYAAGSFAAYKAKQILTGTRVDSIPIERTPKYSLLINMQACKKLGIYPPVTMLRMAEIIE